MSNRSLQRHIGKRSYANQPAPLTPPRLVAAGIEPRRGSTAVAPCFGSQTGCRICGSQQPLVEAELQPSEKPKSISTEATEVEHVGNPNSCEHREAWLHGLISAMRPIFAEHGVEIPANIRVSCGFPSQRSLNGVRNQRIGECWADTDSKDGSFEIFISPTLADAMRVAGATAHELIHATVGLTAGHKGPFKRLALAIGLAGKMSETQEGEAFKRALEPILEGLGPYPHAELDARKRARLNGGPPLTSGPKTQGTRLLKAMCPLCNYTVRVTKKWVDDMGPPLCPAVPPKFPVAHGAMEIESEECR